MKLTEILDTSYKYSVVTNRTGIWEAEFTDDKGFLIEICATHVLNQVWLFQFTRDDRTEKIDEGDAFKIFGTVIKAAKEFLTDRKPDFAMFSADKNEQSRVSLYKRMLGKIKIPGYRTLKEQDFNKLELATESFIRKMISCCADSSEILVIADESEIGE
jgi:hypothetical protein